MAWLSDATRFIQFTCVLSLFGTAGWMWTNPELEQVGWPPRWTIRRLRLVYGAGSLLAAAASLGWLVLEAVTIGGRWSAVTEVVASTHFGRAAALRAALLVVAALLALLMPPRGRRLWAVLAVLYAAITISFVGSGHGSVGPGAAAGLHTIADALHLFCAAIWIGALLGLSASAWQALANRTPATASILLQNLLRVAAIAPALIGLLVGTGLINTWLLVGGNWGALLTQPYGWLLIGKVAVFAVMLTLAAYHRYRSTPRLQAILMRVPTTAPDVVTLQRTLFAETALALLVLAIVAVLGSLAPPVSS